MSFIAGIASLSGCLPDHIRTRFNKCIQAMPLHPAMEKNMLDGTSSILFQAGYSGMWRGPKLLQTQNGWTIAATGAENLFSGTSQERQTTEALCDWISSSAESATMPGEMLHFSAACLSPAQNRLLLATDHLGTAMLSYCVGDQFITFSSKPSFLYRFCEKLTLNYDAIFEFCLIGHLLGNKTFYKEISVLPPGGLLQYSDSKVEIRRYVRFEDVDIDTGMDIEAAGDGIWQLLSSMLSSANPDALKVDCFLSGGWDSRLLAAWLANYGLANRTWTTDNMGMFKEYQIASHVAQYLQLDNNYISPAYLSQSLHFDEFGRLVDFSTDSGPWIISLLDALPSGRVFVDGHLVDVLLRSDRHAPPSLIECVRAGNFDEAASFFHEMYLEIGGPFSFIKGGGKIWRRLLKTDFFEEQAMRLKENILNEFSDVKAGQDFVTSFGIRNRQRRGIAPQPISLIGHRGFVFLPFCSPELVRFCLSVPLEHKVSGRLQYLLLEKAKRGLGDIVSTNSTPAHLHSYRKRMTVADITRQLIYGGWLYSKVIERLDTNLLVLLRGTKSEAKLRLLGFPYQLPRLLFVQAALTLHNRG